MYVEKKDNIHEYKDLSMSVAEWQEYAYFATHDLIDRDYRTITTQKKVTNPPKIYDHKTTYLTTSCFCEDGQYVVPPTYLGAGVESCIQTRILIGITAGANSVIKGG